MPTLEYPNTRNANKEGSISLDSEGKGFPDSGGSGRIMQLSFFQYMYIHHTTCLCSTLRTPFFENYTNG